MPVSAQYDDPALDAALRALAHPGRRAILHLVAHDALAPSQLATACGLTRPATSQHLRALREAGLVSVQRTGGGRRYRARPERLSAVARQIDSFWADRLAVLQRTLQNQPEDARP